MIWEIYSFACSSSTNTIQDRSLLRRYFELLYISIVTFFFKYLLLGSTHLLSIFFFTKKEFQLRNSPEIWANNKNSIGYNFTNKMNGVNKILIEISFLIANIFKCKIEGGPLDALSQYI
jgi:hypothetical protein